MYAHDITELAAEQHGVFGRRQALDAGLSDAQITRRIASGQWETVHPKVYRVAGAPDTWFQRLHAAVLWGGDAAVVSHRAAAELWRLDGEWGRPVEITVPWGHNERVAEITTHRTRRLRPRDRWLHRGLPITGPERTLVDLSAVLDKNDLEVALESAVRIGRTEAERLWPNIDAHRGRRGLRNLRRLLVIRQPEVAYSRWEVRLLQLIREAGLPEPVRQFLVWDGHQWRKIDLAYPELTIALEYDSYTWHSGRRAWERDHTRNADLVSLGWRVLPITLDDVDLEPKRTIARIRRLRRTAMQCA